jgi:hypothetical protein
MLCEEEEIEVYWSISPFALYHMHKMHLLFIKLYPSLFGGLVDQGLGFGGRAAAQRALVSCGASRVPSPMSQPESLRHAMDRYHTVYLTVLQRYW